MLARKKRLEEYVEEQKLAMDESVGEGAAHKYGKKGKCDWREERKWQGARPESHLLCAA